MNHADELVAVQQRDPDALRIRASRRAWPCTGKSFEISNQQRPARQRDATGESDPDGDRSFLRRVGKDSRLGDQLLPVLMGQQDPHRVDAREL